VGISRDITERKRDEDELARHKNRLEEMVGTRTSRLKDLNEQLHREIVERQRTQRELQEEHGRLRIIMDNLAGCHLFVKDRESRFVLANAFQMKTLGVASAHNVVGKTDFDFFPKEMAEQYYADEQDVMSSGQPLLNHEEPCADGKGQRRWLLSTKVPLRDASGRVTGLVGMSLDITEVKKASDALAEERNLLRTVVDALPLWIYAKDMDSRFFVANKTLARRIGDKSPEEVVGKTDFDFMPSEMAQPYYDEEQALMKRGGPAVARVDCYVDGEGKDVVLEVSKRLLRDSQGKIIGMVGVNTEVTELRRNEAALQESQKKLEEERNLLRTLIDNIPHDVYVKDTQGRFVVANLSVAKTMKAKGAEDLLGKTDFDFYPEGQALEYQADENELLSTGRPIVNKVEPKTAENGEALWILTTKLPLRDRDGKIVGIAGVGVNDTKRKLEEEKRRWVEEQLRQSEKMKAIGQLAGGIAHDFNNQLAAIVGSADMIRTWPDEKGVAEHADMILTASKRAADLTGKLLAFARKGRYQSVPVNMHKIIAEVVALLERSIDKRIKIVTRLSAGEAVVKGDPTQLQNALLLDSHKFSTALSGA